jgi:hypothetical protein
VRVQEHQHLNSVFEMEQLMVTTAVLAMLPTAAVAEPNKALYELQERCSKQVSERFERRGFEGTGIDDGSTLSFFNNHYNARLNKCIYLESNVTTTKNAVYARHSLMDLHGNRVIGSSLFIGNVMALCSVDSTPCRTGGEWLALIKPFMEE